MISTVEIRWFGPGEAPAELQSWYASYSGIPERQPKRRDHYLRRIADDGLGVKIREGGLEIKQRQDSHGLVHVGRSMAGLAEQWVKWRFPLDTSLNTEQGTIASPDSWLAVDKERQLRHFLVNHDGNVRAVPPPIVETTSVHIELATVLAGGSRWWTLAFEAAGGGMEALKRLVAVARLYFEGTPPYRLSEADSFSYPSWLKNQVEKL